MLLSQPVSPPVLSVPGVKRIETNVNYGILNLENGYKIKEESCGKYDSSHNSRFIGGRHHLLPEEMPTALQASVVKNIYSMQALLQGAFSYGKRV